MSDDAKAIEELAAVSEIKASHTVEHYLYVPSHEAATLISEELRRRGFRTEERIGADEKNWLVLASHEVIPSENLLSLLRESMEELAATAGGEYDGWEATVRR
jgi:hypothetical protein